MSGRLCVLSSNEIHVLDYLVPPAVSVRIWLAQLSPQLSARNEHPCVRPTNAEKYNDDGDDDVTMIS